MRARFFILPLLLLALAAPLSATDPPVPPKPTIILPTPPKPDVPIPTLPPNTVQLVGDQVYDIVTTAPVAWRWHPAGVVSVTKRDIPSGTIFEKEANYWDGSKTKTYTGPCTIHFLKSALKPDAAPATSELDLIPFGFTDEKQIVGLSVTVNAQNPIPPPKPKPEPPKPEPPKPEPVTSFRVIFVYESADNLTAAERGIVYGKAVEEYLNASCTGGKAGWRRRDKNLGGENDPTMAALWSAVQPEFLPPKNTKTPAVAVEVNGKVEIIALPATPAEMIAILKKYNGGK